MSEEKANTLGNLSGEQLQSAVQSILEDPAFGKLLAQVQGKSPEETPAVPAITPEMMAKLPQMMSALAPLVQASAGAEEKPKEGGKGGADEAEKRRKLLLALRPYLSDGRREAVDGILKVTEMTDLLGGLHLPGSRS